MWICISGTKGGDPFLTRYGVSATGRGDKKRRIATGGDCAKTVKDSARMHGLPVEHFSSSSCRKAAVTGMDSSGAHADAIRRRTGHAPGSSVGDTHYNYSKTAAEGGRSESIGPAALANSRSFGVEDLKRLLPHETKITRSSLGRGTLAEHSGEDLSMEAQGLEEREAGVAPSSMDQPETGIGRDTTSASFAEGSAIGPRSARPRRTSRPPVQLQHYVLSHSTVRR